MIFDAHLDLSLNALDWNRDLLRSLDELRETEAGLSDRAGRGAGTVTLCEMRRGSVGLCVATLLAPTTRPENPIAGWNSPLQAWAHIQGQLAWYEILEEKGEITLITDRTGLDRAIAAWRVGPSEAPISCILSLEGADPVLSPQHLEPLYERGLRALGPAHYGNGIYAAGTDADAPLCQKGRELLRKMDELGIILDLSHLCDTAFREALDIYQGPVWASHSNCRALVPHQRQLAGEQILSLIERDAVIGTALDTWMLVPNWERGVTTPESAGVTLAHAADHIDHVCQLAGNARHAGIGSDLDGGFGREQSPADLDSIADLPRLFDILRKRGYADEDLDRIRHGNFLRVLHKAWN